MKCSDLLSSITTIIPKIIPLDITQNKNTSLLELVLYIMKNMTIKYVLSYVSFTPLQLGINNPTSITITDFRNDLISNIE
jgi:hypothetical protein